MQSHGCRYYLIGGAEEEEFEQRVCAARVEQPLRPDDIHLQERENFYRTYDVGP